MIRISTPDAESELDCFVAEFEAAHARGAADDLAGFLPPKQHVHYLEILCEIVRIDLEFHWTAPQGTSSQPRRLTDYQKRFPELFANRQMLEAVCFEEYRLRRLASDSVLPREYEQCYGIDVSSWDSPDERASREAALPGARAETRQEMREEMPRVGDRFLGFELIGELGCGSFATVFLARQAELANRPVALKVSRERLGESQILARLQHTNIVPIYSTHQAGDLRVVCMPYFGATTLADVLRVVRNRGGLPPSGALLVDTLRACRDVSDDEKLRVFPKAQVFPQAGAVRAETRPISGAPPQAVPAACLQAIAELDYVQAVLWIASRLAEGLEHAHQRGILHRDLKPANVLLTDDGPPMLLDFNLSAPVRGTGLDRVGGTLPYMAPENLAAYRDGVSGGDARGDLYSLGVMIFELLTGQLPFPLREGAENDVLEQMIADRARDPERPRILGTPVPRRSPSPRRLNPAVSPAVDAIVRMCLMPDPESRYASAANLGEDLQRQLRSEPLRHVREPSLLERAAKWRRRHPRATSATSVAAVAVLVVGLLAAALAARGSRLAALEATAALADFNSDFRAAQVAMLDGPTAPPARLAKIEAACRRALDHFRVLDDPQWSEAGDVRNMTAAQRQEARADVGELLFLLAAVTRLQADGAAADQSAAIGRAMEFNHRAEAAWPPDQAPAALWQQRASFAAEAGDEAAARQSLARADAIASQSTASQSTRDTCMKACVLVAERRYRAALPLWQQATRRDPQNVWTWYGLGNCRENLGQFSEAAACYTACIALKPDYYDWYFSRGAVYLKQKDFAAAAADFDEVLRRQEGHAEAHFNRAIARIELGQPQEAIRDLESAAGLGADSSRLHLLLARAWDRAGNADAARSERLRGEQMPPGDEAALVALAFSRAAQDPAAALADVDQALSLNEHYLPAWQSKVHLLAEQLDRPGEAVAALDRAIALYPEAASLVAARGVLFARQSNAEAAERDARAALELDPAPEVQYQAACIYALLARTPVRQAFQPDVLRLTPRQAGKPEVRFTAKSLEFLTAALRGGYGGDLVRDDRDLVAIRSTSQYQNLIKAVDSLRLGAAKSSAASAAADVPN